MTSLKLLTIAALDWRNGLEYAVEAVHWLTQRSVDVHLNIAGSGDFLEAVVFARHELGLDKRIRLLINSGDIHPASLLDDADIFLLPCVAPGAKHALDAALLTNKPVVCFELPEMTHLRERKNVHLVPRRDVEALVSCLSTLVSS